MGLLQIFIFDDPACGMSVTRAEQIDAALEKFRDYADIAATTPDMLASAAIFDAFEFGFDGLDRRRHDVQRHAMIYTAVMKCGADLEALKAEIVAGDVGFNLRPDRRAGVVTVARRAAMRRETLPVRAASEQPTAWMKHRRLYLAAKEAAKAKGAET